LLDASVDIGRDDFDGM